MKSNLLIFQDDTSEEQNLEQVQLQISSTLKDNVHFAVDFESDSQSDENLTHSQHFIAFGPPNNQSESVKLPLRKQKSYNDQRKTKCESPKCVKPILPQISRQSESGLNKADPSPTIKSKPRRLLAFEEEQSEQLEEVINLDSPTKQKLLDKHNLELVIELDAEQDRKKEQTLASKINLLNLENNASQWIDNEPQMDIPTGGQEDKRELQQRIRSNELFYPTSESKKTSNQIASLIAKYENPQTVFDFIVAAIPQDTVMRFQIHEYNEFLSTYFELWLYMENNIIRLLRAEKQNGINFDRTAYTIFVAFTNCSQPLASLVSDFKRKKYNLLIGNQTNEGIVLATIKNKTEFFIPPVDEKTGRHTKIYQSGISTSLSNLYELSSRDNRIKRLTNIKMNGQDWFKVAGQQDFKKSNRTCLVVDEMLNCRFFIGKKSSKYFQIFLGEGISPLQAFAFAIVLMAK